ncbi:fimbrial biogenesis chaperone [Xanthomonas vasicola]|uniref:fimbrial biogenesis chaperone n=1 Tax=Xanthomonas vasicola TaxID=56459 RepID=UPI0001CC0B36|nr:molecular chaperone [Xanthomonas vasicola]AZR31578.1 molecular chaperone [Xanthomonas vasicola pv. musacearum NCPPB 4379]KFA06147.1 pilus assembly protein [Xanthomonas vasicola pv. musacearum NCPPB 2005]KFA09126.1 pilus assembly protein [Xanthomonas vasicola pv. musacearum NCPPB 4380]KFA17467.1 pilus assembly protein [Xanthomonas vasicola pv. musacearum NCPPB 4392]KFA17685.1 pilus assembly protein [Xanthomonas vasicola pv. musacearum NCPPB 4394]
MLVHHRLLSRFPAWLTSAGLAMTLVMVNGVLLTPAHAASLQLAPTSLSLSAQQAADGLWLSNSGSAPVQVQTRAYRWTQRDGQDQLEPTQDLLVSPPMRTLAAGERQVIRAGPAPTGQEHCYRIIVDELPSADADRKGMQFVLRYSVPIFLLPPGTTEPTPTLSAQVVAGSDGKAQIQISNTGNGHAQVADLRHQIDGATKTTLNGLVGYVLPGQTMRWSLGAPLAQFGRGTIIARINGEADERTLLASPTAP